MNISNTTSTDKPEDLLVTAEQLQKFVEQAAQDGMALYDTEKSVLATVLRMGFLAIDEFLKLQGIVTIARPKMSWPRCSVTNVQSPIKKLRGQNPVTNE